MIRVLPSPGSRRRKFSFFITDGAPPQQAGTGDDGEATQVFEIDCTERAAKSAARKTAQR